MTLHRQVRAEREHLVGAESIRENALRTGRDAERLAMPLKDSGGAGFCETIAKPKTSAVIVFGAGDSPANFLNRAACNVAAERFAHQLAAETMADNRNTFGVSISDKCAYLIDPWQWIVGTHRTTHQTKAGKCFCVCRNGFASVNGNQLPWNRAQIEECGKIAWSLGYGVAKNGDRFHDQTVSCWR